MHFSDVTVFYGCMLNMPTQSNWCNYPVQGVKESVCLSVVVVVVIVIGMKIAKS